jgi:hypothetical protein
MRAIVEFQKGLKEGAVRIRLMIKHTFTGEAKEKTIFETVQDFKKLEVESNEEARAKAMLMADRLALKIMEIRSI